MKIILDTNPIHRDFTLSQPQLQTIEKYLSRFTDELYIPEVVIEEMVRHYQKEYSNSISVHKDVQQVCEVIGEVVQDIITINEAVSKFRGSIQDRLDVLGAKVLPIPNADVKLLLERDLAERKPFDSSGKGFRDALIWESILADLINHQEEVVFISADRAFISVDEEGNKRLNQDLADDLVQLGIEDGRVEIIETLRAFNEKYVVPTLARVYRRGDEIIGSFIESLDPIEMLTRYQPFILRQVDEELLRLFSISRGSLGEVRFLSWPENAEILEAFDLNDNKVQVIIRATMLIDAEIYTDHQGFSAIYDLGKRKDTIAFPIDTKWTAARNEFEIKVRTRLIADTALMWDLDFDKADGIDLLNAALNEEGLLPEDLSDMFTLDSA